MFNVNIRAFLIESGTIFAPHQPEVKPNLLLKRREFVLSCQYAATTEE